MSKISVLMPVFNTAEEYLREAIESILNQTCGDFELIILDDGSTNNCKDVILSYGDERIKYFKNEANLGLPKTRNKLLELANSEYIAFMDSDDISDKTRLEKQVNLLDSLLDIGIVGTDCLKFPVEKITQYPTDKLAIKNTFLFENCAICSASAMIRKSVLTTHNIKHDNRFENAEDYAFWLELIDLTNFANISEVLYKYRWHGENISKSGTSLQSLNAQYVMIRAQGKHFNIENTKVLSMIEKLKKKQKIDSDDLKALEDFADKISLKMHENKVCCEYNLNRTFYKIALKSCRKDFNYLRILWNSKLNEFAQVRTWTKIENTLRIF